jgi:hypothetical protein
VALLKLREARAVEHWARDAVSSESVAAPAKPKLGTALRAVELQLGAV